MAKREFRFIHAADLQLDQSFRGIGECPENLRKVLVDARIDAATRLFDAAVEHEVDFILLTGHVIDPTVASPRNTSYLIDQFNRLGEKGIAVYWFYVHSQAVESWNDVQMPKNVSLVQMHPTTTVRHRHENWTLASLTSIDNSNVSQDGESLLSDEVGFQIAIMHGDVSREELAELGIDYCAMNLPHQNGRQSEHTFVEAGLTFHYPGTHQTLSASDTGPRGCTLVTVRENKIAELEPIPTCSVCWFWESITVNESDTIETVKQKLAGRMSELAEESLDSVALVSWRLEGPFSQTRELLGWLRSEFADKRPPLWTVTLDVELAEDNSPEWQQEDTLLGEFLRGIQRYKDEMGEPIDLQSFLSSDLADALASTVELADPVKRRQVLREATVMGVELFRGKEAG